jgi:hypothetical protein
LSLSQHSQKQNKRKDDAILILLSSKSYAFNILVLVFSQKPSENKLQRKKPELEGKKVHLVLLNISP